MSMTMEITAERDFLSVRLAGEFSLVESNRIATCLFRALAKHSQLKVLIDFREVIGEPTTIERFLFSTFMVEEMDRFSGDGVSRATHFGFVGTEPMLDRGRFGETVAVNRGLFVKVVDNLEAALLWLKIDPVNA